MECKRLEVRKGNRATRAILKGIVERYRRINRQETFCIEEGICSNRILRERLVYASTLMPEEMEKGQSGGQCRQIIQIFSYDSYVWPVQVDRK
jgi:hypothetical protein